MTHDFKGCVFDLCEACDDVDTWRDAYADLKAKVEALIDAERVENHTWHALDHDPDNEVAREAQRRAAEALGAAREALRKAVGR